MIRNLLSLVFILVLSGTVGAVPAGGNLSSTRAEPVATVHLGGLRPEIVVRSGSFHRGAFASVSVLQEVYDDDSTLALEIAASTILSWTENVTTSITTRIVEENCLARAVYFEARSEPEVGQMAVATVILNRVKAANYPPTVCGVVFQGASRFNSCQFSFACDGKSDLPENDRAWKKAVDVAIAALDNETTTEEAEELQVVANATHYHADYVKPKWSKSLNRLTKIGHHIFYSKV